MFIIWGETDSERVRGVVADKCTQCRKLALLRVSDLRRKPHVYFIPLGSGNIIAVIAVCLECGGKTHFTAGSYPGAIPEKTAKALPLEDVLQQTNPDVATALAARARLEKAAREGRQTPGKPDPRVELAFARLADLGRDERVPQLMSRLAQWSALAPEVQAVLLREIDTLCAERAKLEETSAFLSLMAQRFKPDPDGCLAIITLVGVFATGVMVSIWTLLNTGFVGWGILASVVLAITLSIMAHRSLRRWTHRRFFRATFLPAADKQGIDLTLVLAILRSLNPADEQLAPGWRGLAQARPLLLEVLREDGRPLEELPEG